MEEIDPRELKYQILLAGFSMKRISEEAGISIRTTREGLSGKSNITIENYNALVRAFNKLKGEKL